MSVINKIENLVFQGGALASVEIVKDRIIVVKMGCVIERLSNDECYLLSSHGTKYKILGDDLQVREYGDTYIKVEGKRITGFLIDGGEGCE